MSYYSDGVDGVIPGDILTEPLIGPRFWTWRKGKTLTDFALNIYNHHRGSRISYWLDGRIFWRGQTPRVVCKSLCIPLSPRSASGDYLQISCLSWLSFLSLSLLFLSPSPSLSLSLYTYICPLRCSINACICMVYIIICI